MTKEDESRKIIEAMEDSEDSDDSEPAQPIRKPQPRRDYPQVQEEPEIAGFSIAPKPHLKPKPHVDLDYKDVIEIIKDKPVLAVAGIATVPITTTDGSLEYVLLPQDITTKVICVLHLNSAATKQLFKVFGKVEE